ncbi:MAG: geranylgeranyl reductase family protein [Chloroflexi bacterium]|nr:geranylgeranyl reductase family protein [Chloroflexota bacterium]
MSKVYDAIIVGAGPGGSALATSLARSGLDILLLDKHHFPRDKTCGDALSPSAVGILRHLGLEDVLGRVGFRIDGLQLTMPGGELVAAPILPTSRDGDSACVIPRLELDELLRSAAIRAGSEFAGGVRVTEIIEEQGLVLGSTNEKRSSWSSRIVILAVGANVGLLKRQGLVPKRLEFSYAVRSYIKGITAVDRQLHIRFDGVPLPGYGWIFPVSRDSANVGVVAFRKAKGTSNSIYAVFERFLRQPLVAEMLSMGHPRGSTKGYPLRTDFHRSPIRRGRLLLIGEAAGLVNPFTGEGIDYALESAMVASESLRDCFATGDFSEHTLSRYDQALRARFQRIFVLTSLMRRIYMNPRLLDALGRACGRWPDVAPLMVDIFLGRTDPLRAFSPGLMLRILRSLPTAS